jgi:L-aminopeptidase/D-esterase-like protein
MPDIEGVLVGHWTDPVGRTGCTVVLLPEGCVASGEVRGGAPGTREFDLLEPTRTVSHVDAVLLTGGSAFGLSAADGVMRWCEERGRGFPVGDVRVPIVVGAVIFDLGVGDPGARPRPDDAYAACASAVDLTVADGAGSIGAGTGATRSKWRGPAGILPGGLGTSTVRVGDLVVRALVVVNPIGDVIADGAKPSPDDLAAFVGSRMPTSRGEERANTTIGVVFTSARLDKVGCHLVAQSGHDGIARSIWPSHLRSDGDALVVVAVPPTDGGAWVDAPVDAVRAMAADAVAIAVRASVVS